jgi:hypothetical protein
MTDGITEAPAAGIGKLIMDIRSALDKMKKQDRNRKLLESLVFAHERIAQLAAAKGNPKTAAKYLFDFVNFMRDKVSVVKLSVASEEAAYTIFETLNDRGLDLSPLDLVKNHLFGKADKNIRLKRVDNNPRRLKSCQVGSAEYRPSSGIPR